MNRTLFGDVQNDYYNPAGPAAPVAWYGGKAYYAQWIIGAFPKHRVYVEPFGGAANVLLRKHPSEVEIFNDLDERVVNLFRVLRNRRKFEELQRLVSLTPYSRAEFAALAKEREPQGVVARAFWFFVRCRQAIGGIGMSKLNASSWAMSVRTRRRMAEPVSKYLSAIEGLQDVAERFRSVVIEALPADVVIRKYDADDALIYCDPPYLAATRHGGRAATYGQEMSPDDHADLLSLLRDVKSRVILSGYESHLYDDMLSGWANRSVEGKAHLANSGQKRTEYLWFNFDPDERT